MPETTLGTETDDQRADLEVAAIGVALAFRDLSDGTMLPLALTEALIDLDEVVARNGLLTAPNLSRRGS